MGLDERRRWLFPIPRGEFDGIDLDRLDPHDEGDREILVRAEHPDLDRILGASEGSFDVQGQPFNPRLHLIMHEVVATQLWNDDPPEVGQTAERLLARGFDRHEVLHMLGSVNTEEIWNVRHTGEPSDPKRFRAALDALPESWLDQGDGEDDDLLMAALETLSQRGPLTADELVEELDAHPADIEDLMAESGVVVLADLRLAALTDLLDETVFTHRLSREEIQSGDLLFGVDLLPLERMLCDGDHLHLADGTTCEMVDDVVGDIAPVLRGAPGWLGRATAGDLIGFRIAGVDATEGGPAPVVAVETVSDPPATPDTFARRLGSSFHQFGSGDGIPVDAVDLVCQVAVDAPALMGRTLVPLSELFETAGFEVRAGHAAPQGTDWDQFDWLRSVAEVARRHDLDTDRAHALVILCQLVEVSDAGGLGSMDRHTASSTAEIFADPDIAEAFAEANVETSDSALRLLSGLQAIAGDRHAADLAWTQSLLARRKMNPEGAESYLRMALAADPDHEWAVEDAAWYASDRGDARAAVRLLQRLEEDPEEDRTRMLERYAGGGRVVSVGRNDPCPCGSGRKYKHCCLGAGPVAAPLPERVRWIWEKLRWWLDRSGREEDAFNVALVMHGPPARDDMTSFTVDLDIAASLVLFADRAVDDFLAERGALLPDDESNLVTQWALSDRSVHEVVSVAAGEGATLRDLRTGDVVDVTERKGSRSLKEGDLLFAHPVFDGTGHQFVGGLVPIPPFLRDPMLALIDSEAGAMEFAELLSATRRHPSPTADDAAPALDLFIRQKEEQWVDEPVPALAGLTPRQAADDPTRRDDLIALLHDFDRHQPPPGAVTFDTTRLRALLGLGDGSRRAHVVGLQLDGGDQRPDQDDHRGHHGQQ